MKTILVSKTSLGLITHALQEQINECNRREVWFRVKVPKASKEEIKKVIILRKKLERLSIKINKKQNVK